MILLFSSLCTYERKKDSTRLYILLGILMLLCISAWAIYTEIDWIIMVWGVRTFLIALANFLIAKCKRVKMPQQWLILPITLIVGVPAVAVQLLLTVNSTELAQWNSFAFGIFEMTMLLIAAVHLVNEKNP